ncbi:MAG: hypothetical protein CEE43_00095 [Promethearchaeota archaeon Loki_b32]|nr:MAG: hypothetical protein CEE43_00095 [Candidatus Lokiarchaeota archaeon Loki_b32]
MNFLRARKSLNISKIIEKIENKIRKILLFKYYNKKREIIRKSGISDEFFWRMLGSPKISDIRNLFFNNNIFAYSNKEEKEKIIECLKNNCSREINDYLNFADKVIRKEFDIFEKTHIFDEKIDWHYSFFNGFRWKLQKSEKMDIRPKDKQVDVKYTWEFNRHQFLIYLGFTFYYTKNERYAKEFKNVISDWIKSNPPLYGINWYSGLEISIRLISWIYALYFFEDSIEINNDQFFKKIFVSMSQHAFYLKYFYTRCSFNHTIGDLFGVYLFSKIFDHINPFKKWEKIFYIKFKRQIFLQTRPDGTNIERSVNYHRFVLEFFSLFMILNPNKLKGEELKLIEKMYNYLLYIIKPNGTFPLIGDSDNGKVLLLTFHKKDSFIDLINLGSILFQRGDLKFHSSKLLPPSILLLGSKNFEIYNNLKIIKPNTKLKYFNDAGYFLIKNNWTSKANYLFIDLGRFGARNAGHSHSSITNIIYSYKGKNIITDSGTYTYNKSWEERNYFRSSKAHNVLTINNQNQAMIKSWFSWENKPRVKSIINIQNNKIELGCYHNGYKGFSIKRNIITNRDLNNILIKDTVIRSQEIQDEEIFDIKIYYHFSRGLNISLENNIVNIDNEILLKVSSSFDFNVQIDKSLYSPNYGEKYENSLLNISSNHSFKQNAIFEILIEIKNIK